MQEGSVVTLGPPLHRVPHPADSRRDNEEFAYRFKRDQQIARDKLNDEKAIEGSSQARSLADLQELLTDQSREAPAESA